MQTEHEEYIANQKVTKAGAISKRFEAIREVQSELVGGFDDATRHPEQNASTLFGRLVQREAVKVKVHSRKSVLQRRGSQTVQLEANRRRSIFIQDGKMISSQHLLALTKEQSERNKLNMKASELYIPKEKRKLRDKLKGDGDFPKAQLPKEKKVEFDVDLMKAQLQQI